MHEITPEVIASIATQLYRQLPGGEDSMPGSAGARGVPVPSDVPVAANGPMAATSMNQTTPPYPAGSPPLLRPASVPVIQQSPINDAAAALPATNSIPLSSGGSPGVINGGGSPPSLLTPGPAISPRLLSSAGGPVPSPQSASLLSPSTTPAGHETISHSVSTASQQSAGESLSGIASPATKSIPENPFAFLRSPEKFAGFSLQAMNLASEVQQQDHSARGAGHQGNYSDGLRKFVSAIRTGNSASGNGLCEEDPALGEIRKRFAARNTETVTSRPFDVAVVRRDFPILRQRIHGRPLVWFDNAATTQKPQHVIDTLKHFYENDNSNIHRGAHTLAARATDAYEGARKKIQQFLGANSPDEIIFVRGTTEGINLVAKTFGKKFLTDGDEIVLSTLEHHANIVPWQMIAQETGAVIRVIPVNDHGEILMEEYQRLLGPRTKLVALTQASNSLGTILPVEEMTQAAKRYGARVLIDGAQSVAHIPVNVQTMDCDFFVFSGHKIFGPTGIGAVFGKKEVLEMLPPWQGGGNMIRDVTFEETSYHGPPARFEAGTPNVADAVGLGAALDYVNQLGLPNIAKYEHELLQYGTELLSRIDGLHLIGTARRKVGVLSFVLDGFSTEEVGRRLDQEGIAVRSGHHCSQPSLRRFGLESTVRPSLSLYNTHEELDRLAEAIRRIRQRRL
jgi:cysteine desulfurase / selenocysteine lyase